MTDLPAAAITAATWALHGRSKNDTSGAMDGICACLSAEEHDVFLAEDEAAATAVLEAAAPHITAAATAAERERLRKFARGLGDDCTDVEALFREVMESGAALERQRIRQLAQHHHAVCGGKSGDPDLLRPFADLLTDTP